MDVEEVKREEEPRKRRTLSLLFFLCIPMVLSAIIFFIYFISTPPSNFPLEERISIPAGSSLSDISFILKNKDVIRSGLAFRIVMLWHGEEESIPAGEYLFHEPHSLFQIVESFLKQTDIIPPVKVTIPEGSTLEEFDRRLSDALVYVNPGDIMRSAEGKEGVLFPDTYILRDSILAEDAVALLRATFDEKLEPYSGDFAKNSLSREQIITLASIVEREANDKESMHIVAGILLKRLEKGMPLQVDATFDYILHKTSAELTAEDLEIDSPYNTYRHRGLPPTPIASPGIMAIEAVLHPTETPYLYYLTDNKGVFHYAKTFDEHKHNKALYLR